MLGRLTVSTEIESICIEVLIQTQQIELFINWNLPPFISDQSFLTMAFFYWGDPSLTQ